MVGKDKNNDKSNYCNFTQVQKKTGTYSLMRSMGIDKQKWLSEMLRV